jgi:hypothetical protein
MVLAVQRLKDTPNDILMDAIRNRGSNDYQARIPEATKAGIQTTMNELLNHRTLYNEFVDALVNRIGLVKFKEFSWTNPLSEFKQGMLQYGDTIEEVAVGLIKAKTYDPNREALEREIFGTHRPEVQANFHKVNRQDYYPVTVNESLLQRAFLQDGGLVGFISQLMGAPATSDQWDEFLATCQLFAEYEAKGGFFKIKVPDVSDLNSSEADAKFALRMLRATADTIVFPSRKYNAAGLPMAARRDELVIFTTPDFKAAMDVEALAGAFNMDSATAHGRIITIPEERFGIDGAQAIMTTKDFFVIADQKFETASQYNPVALQNNYFLHHWQVISASRFVPAVLFTTKGGTEFIEISTPVTSVSEITILDREGLVPDSVVRGELYALDAEAVTTPADGVNDGVRWSVTGNTSTRTYISQTGVLHVGGDEGATSLVVTATSTWLDPDGLMRDGEQDSITLTVSGTAVPTWPETAAVSGITIAGGTLVPPFAVGTYTYTVEIEGGVVTADDVTVTGPDSDNVEITVSEDGDTVTIESASSTGDPVYTVNVVEPTP